MPDCNLQTSRDSRTAGIWESRKVFNLTFKTSRLNGEDLSEDNPLLNLEELLNLTWNIWGVTVLFNFNFENEVQLKQYAKKLREEIASILSQENVSYEAKISVWDAKPPKETDHPAVKIEVLARMTDRGDKESCVYKGYLISWRSDTSADVPTENSSRLPLLLCRGTPNTMRAVHTTLTRMFDCMIVELPTNAEDLKWLLPIVISPERGQDEARENDEVELEYGVPGLPRTDSINVKFHVNEVIALWQKFLAKKDKAELEDVEKFHEVLEAQVADITNVELGLCILHKIHLPCLTIAGSKMKIMNAEAMDTILTYLNENALDKLHIDTSQFSTLKR